MYYKLRELNHYKLRQKFITNYDSYYKLRQVYYKLRPLLQIATIITNYDRTDPWVIQKSNKAVETCVLSLKIMKKIYSYDWVPLIRFSLFTSITSFSNISISFSFLFNILVDIYILMLHWH